MSKCQAKTTYSLLKKQITERIDMTTKKQLARNWVNTYAVTGAGLVVAAIVPGSTAIALMGIEGKMCLHIGQIYRGADYCWKDATGAAAAVGVACVAGKVAALEALNFVPIAGWIIKAPVAGSIIKLLGEAIIDYYETNTSGPPRIVG